MRSLLSSSASGSSLPSTYALKKPGAVQVRPLDANITFWPSASVPSMRTLTCSPLASFICEATVRFQISS